MLKSKHLRLENAASNNSPGFTMGIIHQVDFKYRCFYRRISSVIRGTWCNSWFLVPSEIVRELCFRNISLVFPAPEQTAHRKAVTENALTPWLIFLIKPVLILCTALITCNNRKWFFKLCSDHHVWRKLSFKKPSSVDIHT